MMKSEVSKKLKRDAIRNLYNTMFTVFQKGLDGNGRPLFVIDGQVQQPKYPLGHTNSFVLSASETMDSILAKMLEILMPERYTQLTEKSSGLFTLLILIPNSFLKLFKRISGAGTFGSS